MIDDLRIFLAGGTVHRDLANAIRFLVDSPTIISWWRRSDARYQLHGFWIPTGCSAGNSSI